jgi:replicative DNA helicase
MGTFLASNRSEERDDLPASPDAERSILGAILLDSGHYFEAADAGINTFDFSLSSHQRLWSAFSEMIEDGVAPDLVTVTEHLTTTKGRKEIDRIGGIAYIASLTEGLVRRTSIGEYVRIVRDKSKRREIVHEANRMLAAMRDDTSDTSEVIAAIQNRGLELAAEQGAEAVKHISAVVPKAAERVRLGAKDESQTHALGLTTGIQDLDKLTKGMFPNEFTIIGGETGGGKSSMLMQIAIENARLNIPVVIFSVEMRDIQLVSRSFAYTSNIITASMIRDPRGLGMYELEELGKTERKVSALPIYIDDTSGLTLDQLKARVRMAVRRYKARLVIVDYMQLIQIPSIRNTTDRMELVAYGLRDVAKTEENLHVVALSQYGYDDNPGGKKRKRRFKGSSSIEQACQLSLDIEFDPDDDENLWIHINKQREGGKGKVNCRYNRSRLRFETKEAKHNNVG